MIEKRTFVAYDAVFLPVTPEDSQVLGSRRSQLPNANVSSYPNCSPAMTHLFYLMTQRQPPTQRNNTRDAPLSSQRCQDRDHTALTETANDDPFFLDASFLDFLFDQGFHSGDGAHHSGFVVVDRVCETGEILDVKPAARGGVNEVLVSCAGQLTQAWGIQSSR